MRFAYMQENGVTAIVHAVAKEFVEEVLGEITDEEYRAHVMDASIPKGVPFLELPDDWTPPDREFRQAWTMSGKSIGVDMTLAKDVWREKIRSTRVSKLQALDVEFQKAQEIGADTAAIVARKQVLRDATKHPGIDAAETPDELKAFWPDELR